MIYNQCTNYFIRVKFVSYKGDLKMPKKMNKHFNHHPFPDIINSELDDQHYTYINGLGFLPETPQQKEQKQLGIYYNILLFALLLLFFLRVRVLSFVPIANLLSILRSDITINPMTSMITLSKTAYQLVNILSYLFYMAVPSLVIILLLKKKTLVKKMFATPNPKTTRYGVFILIGLAIVAQLFVLAFSHILSFSGVVFSQNYSKIPTEFVPFILYLLSITIIPAFTEEFLFHGVILGSLRRFGDFVAIVVSSVCMTLTQTSAQDMLYVFILSLGLGYLTILSGGIIAPIISNFAIRSLFSFISLVEHNLFLQHGYLITGLLYLTFMLISIIAFCRFIRKNADAFQISNQDTFLTNRTKIKCLLTNVIFWMLVILAFLEALNDIQIIN